MHPCSEHVQRRARTFLTAARSGAVWDPADHARDVGIPLLVVEVPSPSTRPRDRGAETRHLLRVGLEEAHGTSSIRSTALPGFPLTPATLGTPPPGR